MRTQLKHRFYRWVIVMCLLLPTIIQAQPIGNQITIEVVGDSYDCASGLLTINVRIKNEAAVPGRYSSSFHIQTGSEVVYGTAGNNTKVHDMIIPYAPGAIVIIGAYGMVDNDAPYVEHRFIPSSAQLPDAPVISASSTFPLCNGASTVLTASGSTGSYVWSNGATGSSISVNSPGTYTARASGSCGLSNPSNTIVVTTDNVPPAPSVTPSGNLLLCNGESTTLSASGANITWSNGTTGNSIVVNSAGTYSCYSTNGCGNSGISNIVQVSTVTCPTPMPGASFMVCPGFSKTLDAGAGYDTYQWSNGATSRTVTVGPGTYSVTVSKDGCFATSAQVTVSHFTVTTPTINVSGALQFCQGGSVSLTSSSASSYVWNTGATGQSITVGSSGAYYVTVTDGNGCTATSAAVNVTVNSMPSASISGGGSLCAGSGSSPVTFTGNGGIAPYTFSYRINGGSVQTISTSSGNSATLNVPSTSAGSYTYSLVSVKESSATACENAASGEVTVTVNALPSATISGSATVCQGAGSPVITFTGSGGTAPYVFTYELNGGTLQTISSSGNTATINMVTATAGTYAYRLVSVRDASSTSCTNIASGIATIVVNATPVTPVLQTPNTHLCNGVSTTISLQNPVAGTTYQWYKNGVLLTSGSESSITVTTAGSYTVKAVSAEGCTTVESNIITITTGIVSTPVITGKLKVCPGGRTTLGVQASAGLGYEKWRWLQQDTPFGGVLSEDSIFSFHAGQYRVIAEREGCADSALFTVSADDTEFPAGQIKLNANEINYGGLLTLTADVAPAVFYHWKLGNGRSVNTLHPQIQEHYYLTGDSIRIDLEAVTERNCKASFTAYVKVGAMKTASITNQSFTGRLKDWNVFPNPFNRQLKVSVILERAENVRIDLFDVNGRWIKSWTKAGRYGENLFELEGTDALGSKQTYFITGFYNGQKHTDKIYKQ